MKRKWVAFCRVSKLKISVIACNIGIQICPMKSTVYYENVYPLSVQASYRQNVGHSKPDFIKSYPAPDVFLGKTSRVRVGSKRLEVFPRRVKVHLCLFNRIYVGCRNNFHKILKKFSGSESAWECHQAEYHQYKKRVAELNQVIPRVAQVIDKCEFLNTFGLPMESAFSRQFKRNILWVLHKWGWTAQILNDVKRTIFEGIELQISRLVYEMSRFLCISFRKSSWLHEFTTKPQSSDRKYTDF